MTLLASGALWLLGLSGVVGAVYFLKRQAEPRYVSTLMFWRGVERQPRSALRFNRMPLLGLILQLLALVAVVLALAQPVAITSASGAHTLAIVLDGSASMRAETAPDGEPRYERAVARAQAILRANSAAEAALFSAQARSELLVPATTEHDRLHQSLITDEPSHQGDADPSALLRLVESQFPNGVDRVVYLSDRAPSNAVAALGWQTEVVGSPNDAVNVGVTSFAVRKQPDGQGVAFVVEVWNGDDVDRSLPLSIRSADETLVERTVDVAAHASTQIDLSRANVQMSRFVAEIDPGSGRDDLAEDNARFATLPQKRPWRVDWVGGESFYLRRFFERAGRAEVVRKGETLSASSANADLTLAHNTRLDNAQPGRYLLINSRLPPWVTNANGTSGGQVVIDQDHSVLEGLAPDDWRIGESPNVELAPNGTTLLSAGGAPLLYLVSSGGVRLAYLGVDLSASNLGLSVDFPILLFRLLEWLAPRVDRTSTLTVGQELPLDRLSASAEITDPAGQTCQLGRGDASCGRLDQPGIYRVVDGTTTYHFAANAPASESTLASSADGSSSSIGTAVSGSDPSGPLETTRPLWPWALALGLGLLLVELWTFDRPRWARPTWRRRERR